MAQHKLSDLQKIEILTRWDIDEEPAKVLAADYDVSVERIYQIVRSARLPMHQPHSGDFTNNGRKVYEPLPALSLDYVLERLELSERQAGA